MNINETLGKIFTLEQQAAQAKADMSALLESVKESPAYAALFEALKAADTESGELREALKQEFSIRFGEDGNKKPHPAIQIKEFDVVQILDKERAREWCLANFRPALKLDEKTFEKAAKDGTIPADLAMVSKEPRVQIASDLSDYAA